VAEKESKKLLK